MFLSLFYHMNSTKRQNRNFQLSPASMGLAILVINAIFTTGCQPHEGSEKQLREDIDSFANNYYNWHFQQANKYCTPPSEKWLRYAASNVHQADIDLLHTKEEDAKIEIDDIDFHDDEVSASVHIRVSNFLQMDTIGKEAHRIKSASFIIPMVIHEGKWKVDLRAIPLKEK